MAFQKVTILGIKCVVKDEKAMMVRVNDYLATIKRTTSKAKNQSLLDSELPFIIKHFY